MTKSLAYHKIKQYYVQFNVIVASILQNKTAFSKKKSEIWNIKVPLVLNKQAVAVKLSW